MSSEKILLLCGDYYHPAQTTIDGVSFLSSHGYELCPSSDGSRLNNEFLTDCAAVILARGDSTGEGNAAWYTDAQVKALCEYVSNGGGLLSLHAGLTCCDESIRALAGCRFLYHPEQRDVTTAPLNMHPVACAVESFTVHDEHYAVELLQEVTPVFASASVSESGEMLLNIGGYIKAHGKGRVCALMPGHNKEVFENAGFCAAILNAVKWVSGK